MVSLQDIAAFCDTRTRRPEITDFPGAVNGLQFANRGSVTKIGAAVDAGLLPFREAAERGIQFLIVHHGMFWNPVPPITGLQYEKMRTLMEADCAVYGSHLPLDLHPEIGNNVLLARQIGLAVEGTFLEFEGHDIAKIARVSLPRSELRDRLRKHYPDTFTAVEFGSDRIEKAAILTGSGTSAVDRLQTAGIDTLITGELKQNVFNQAQEEGLNLYCCGHYATETHGVRALAEEAAAEFNLPWEFIETRCPL
jgi:dinuclear metal center YbgI/SA1388 family protein